MVAKAGMHALGILHGCALVYIIRNILDELYNLTKKISPSDIPVHICMYTQFCPGAQGAAY